MAHHACRTVTPLLALGVLAPAAGLASQAVPDGINAVRDILVPEIMTVRPRVFSTYGALLGASLLGLLYLYRGRPFIVYWIAAWLLVAAAVSGRAPVADARLGGLMLSVGALLGFWAAGLFYLAPSAFMDQRVR